MIVIAGHSPQYSNIFNIYTVIEHLDPQPLSQFAPVLLGKMKPKVCIITTPNRDFNQVFDIPFTPLDCSPLVKPVTENTNLPNMNTIMEGSLDQFENGVLAENNLTSALEAATKSLGDRIDRDAMFEDPPSRPSSPAAESEPSTTSGDSQSRYWRPGVPYPMRHHDHRFEWTRAEFRAWARTAAEQFGYDVGFSGVGGIGRGMSPIGGTGYAIQQSLEDATNIPFEDGYRGDIGSGLNLGEGLEDLFTTQFDGLSLLGRKANVVFGDCSQIAVFVIKQDVEKEWDEVEGFPTTANSAPDIRARSGSRNEGTASPIFPDAWAPLITPDNWFAHPSFTAPDIRLVCHYSYPWVKNEEFPPNYIRVIEMMQATFNRCLPAMVLEEWQKTPAVLMRDEQRRREGILPLSTPRTMDIDPYDFLEPPTAEVLLSRKMAKQEEDDREATRVKEQTAVMGGMAPEKVEVVKMVIGTRKIWEESYNLRRACHFHYDVFRRIIASSGPEGVMGFAVSPEQEGEGEWATIIDTTNRGHTEPHDESDQEDEMHIEFTHYGGSIITKVTTNALNNFHIATDKLEYDGPQGLFCHGTDKDIIFSPLPSSPQPALEYPADSEAFWDDWANNGDCDSTESSQDDYDPDEQNEQDWNWYHDDDDMLRRETFKVLKLHAIAIWGVGSNADDPGYSTKCKGKGQCKIIQSVRIDENVGIQDKNLDLPKSGILRVGKNGTVYHGEEEWEEWEDKDDIPIFMTWYKPQRLINSYEDTREGSSRIEEGVCESLEEKDPDYLGWNQPTGEEVRWRDSTEVV